MGDCVVGGEGGVEEGWGMVMWDGEEKGDGREEMEGWRRWRRWKK